MEFKNSSTTNSSSNYKEDKYHVPKYLQRIKREDNNTILPSDYKRIISKYIINNSKRYGDIIIKN